MSVTTELPRPNNEDEEYYELDLSELLERKPVDPNSGNLIEESSLPKKDKEELKEKPSGHQKDSNPDNI